MQSQGEESGKKVNQAIEALADGTNWVFWPPPPPMAVRLSGCSNYARVQELSDCLILTECINVSAPLARTHLHRPAFRWVWA